MSVLTVKTQIRVNLNAQSDQVYTVCDSICIFKIASFVENLNCLNFITVTIRNSDVLMVRILW